MDLAIISDTHIPGQADAIPGSFLEYTRNADHVIHCGDFGSIEAYETVSQESTGLTAVYGNADPIDIDLSAIASVTIGEVTFVVTHGIVNAVERAIGSSEGVVFDREDWLDAIATTARSRIHGDGHVVGVGGHTHRVEDLEHDGIRLLNPGSATGAGPAEGRTTMMTVAVQHGELDVNVHKR